MLPGAQQGDGAGGGTGGDTAPGSAWQTQRCFPRGSPACAGDGKGWEQGARAGGVGEGGLQSHRALPSMSERAGKCERDDGFLSAA